ncbi:beta-galactosidase [Vagococcus acidifermentans]|uniref:Beta-galactosidase n=1 Tax=Vagococcus acidifermentans TaxID=564710 RepID=A0A430B2H3_9ENTE|nr:beta-galactosidase [Vagococcus acidifermentans]RSU14499.1 beta-galactosidase [Vagococcus acidifermentans]
MKKMFNEFLYGRDYNPNQWPKEIWEEDMRMFRLANINSTTINVFSWAQNQPSENEYDFSQLDEIIERLSQENSQIVLGTSTAALPAWMFMRYPEVGRVDFEGRRHTFSHRHNACPNSLVYQKYAKNMVEQLAQRYQDHDNIVCWHINNEYGGECYCENCQKAFRVWVKEKYGTVEAVNKAWNMEFWGHKLYSFDEIVVPNLLGDGIHSEAASFTGISLDYCRFMSDSLLDNYKMERDIIKRYDPDTPCTTNLMGTFKGLDYFKWAKEMDIISWDNYPSYNTPWSFVAMSHDLMRGLKDGQPFMLMEQTPSQQNWQPYNSLKKPGQMSTQSYQTIAHGADTIQFFQLRRSVGACEKFHGAVIEHAGHEHTRVFQEVASLGSQLRKLQPILGMEKKSKVAIVFDWDNYWALEFTIGPNKNLKYVDQIHQYYQFFYDKNISVDMISPDSDFSKYDLVVAPVLYLVKEGLKEKLENYVSAGGNFITTYMSGIVNESDNVHLGGYPGPLRQLAGIWVEEIDALAPEQTNSLKFNDGQTGTCALLCDLMHLEGAESLAVYSSNFYKEMPVITRNRFGKGNAWYIGAQLEPKTLYKTLQEITAECNLSSAVSEPTELEVSIRENEYQRFIFIMNFGNEEQVIPKDFVGSENLLTGQKLTDATVVKPYETVIISEVVS